MIVFAILLLNALPCARTSPTQAENLTRSLMNEGLKRTDIARSSPYLWIFARVHFGHIITESISMKET